MIPVARLGIECFATNPPRPNGVGVVADGKVIAVVELDELKRAYQRLLELEKAREALNSEDEQ